ncbi:MAG TPA: PAS domain-containing protein, partial [Spirochaetia bacterium]|nr:PAS domain-containing protein [Spirochaetia bacterium]
MGDQPNLHDYGAIFRHSAISQWVEDISELRAVLDDLKRKGIVDIRSYLSEHADFVRHATELVRVVDVNNAALELYGTRNRDELLGPLVSALDLDDWKTFASIIQDIAAIFEGRSFLMKESRFLTSDGTRKDVMIYSYFPPDLGVSPYMMVSLIDITEQRTVERE